MICPHCDEPILPGEPVSEMRMITSQGTIDQEIHRECHIRSVMGSAEHLLGLCTCGGRLGMEEPTGGFKPRELARRAYRVWMLREEIRTVRESTTVKKENPKPN